MAAVLKTRIVSALVMVPPVLAAVWFGNPYFAVLAAVVAALMAWEWETLCTRFFTASGVLAGLSCIAAALLAPAMPILALAMVTGGAAAVAIERLALGRLQPLWVALGTLYVGLPVVALVWVRADPLAGRETLFWLLFVVWATDTGAYAAGRSIGGPLLAPHISPKKTWAGLLGGVVSAALVGAATGVFLQTGNAAVLAAISGFLAVVAQLGDLWESSAKRHFGVKDSSAIIPGHGGLFDRLDGLLAAAPVVAGVMMAFGGGISAWA